MTAALFTCFLSHAFFFLRIMPLLLKVRVQFMHQVERVFYNTHIFGDVNYKTIFIHGLSTPPSLLKHIAQPTLLPHTHLLPYTTLPTQIHRHNPLCLHTHTPTLTPPSLGTQIHRHNPLCLHTHPHTPTHPTHTHPPHPLHTPPPTHPHTHPFSPTPPSLLKSIAITHSAYTHPLTWK